MNCPVCGAPMRKYEGLRETAWDCLVCQKQYTPTGLGSDKKPEIVSGKRIVLKINGKVIGYANPDSVKVDYPPGTLPPAVDHHPVPIKAKVLKVSPSGKDLLDIDPDDAYYDVDYDTDP